MCAFMVRNSEGKGPFGTPSVSNGKVAPVL
jgi:hypothetical protein